jgi:hypothetical protein
MGAFKPAKASLALCLTTLAIIPQPVAAQPPAPGWFPTGEWRCGPYVRIITSTDGGTGMNFEVIGAWFNNNYTLRRGQLFYNGLPCTAIGRPFGSTDPRRNVQVDEPGEGEPEEGNTR